MASPWTRQNGLEKLARVGLKPAVLELEAAAAYLGMTPKIFKREVDAGRLPPPIIAHGRRKLWSLKALDVFLGGQQNEGETPNEPADDQIMAILNAEDDGNAYVRQRLPQQR